jgi:hypothetical protein
VATFDLLKKVEDNQQKKVFQVMCSQSLPRKEKAKKERKEYGPIKKQQK